MLSSLVFSTTYKCPIECKFCGAESGPNHKTRLSYDDMTSLIDQVGSYGKLQLVVFTGGEPLLLGKDLEKAVRYCAEGNVATRIVTNAFWAKSPKIADKIVARYKSAGLSEINLSCDDYHQEFIPIENIRFANDACIKAELPCLIGHKVMKDCTLTVECLEKSLGQTLTNFDETQKNPDYNVISTGFTVPVARDMDKIPDEDILYPPSTDHWKKPCSSILQRVIITPHKELSICCGMIPRSVEEITFGPIEDQSLEEIIVDAHKDLIVNWLALEGPYGIMQFIRQKDPSISFRDNYVNICHLCSEIFIREDCRKILRDHAEEKIPELTLEKSIYDFVRTSDEFASLVMNKKLVEVRDDIDVSPGEQ